MSDTSTLGPVDPQIWLPTRNRYVPAKEILKIVDDLDDKTQKSAYSSPTPIDAVINVNVVFGLRGSVVSPII